MKTEIRTRFLTPSAQTICETATGEDGKRRIVRDNLGIIEAVPEGWKVTLFTGHEPFIDADRDSALLQAERDIRLIDMLRETNG